MNYFKVFIIFIIIINLNLIVNIIDVQSENKSYYNTIHVNNDDGNLHWWDINNKIRRNELDDEIESDIVYKNSIYKIDSLIYKIPNNF